MNVAGVIIAVGPDPRIPGGGRKPRPRTEVLARAALGANLADVIVVVDHVDRAAEVPDDATVLLDEGESQASALRVAVDWCIREGYDALVFITLDAPLPGGDVAAASQGWSVLAGASDGPLVVGTAMNRHAGFFKVDADAWPVLPLDGAVVAALDNRIELLHELELSDESKRDDSAINPAQPALAEQPIRSVAEEHASAADIARVRELLGRRPAGKFSVVVRSSEGDPIVIRNAPFLDDGTPMPTRYWLVGRREQEAVGRFESTGGVRLLETLIDPIEIAAAHDRYARGRDALIDPHYQGPRPTGGVGGTRRGVKCLHAHLAWYLAGGGDPVGRYVAHQLANEISGRVGAIDCGTNSTRLLILEVDGSVLCREMTITRLGQGVDQTKRLYSDAIERTVAALRTYREILDRFGVVRLRATTTSAARDADNRAEFFSRAKEVLGVELELLSGDEEGRLSYVGATSDIEDFEAPSLVVDIGGGSTEFAAGGSQSNSTLAVASLNIGCVRVTERYLVSDPPTPEELAAASATIRTLCTSLVDDQPAFGLPKRLIAVAGTVATLATLTKGLASYDGVKTHNTVISRAFVDEILYELARAAADQRRQIAGIEPERADVIVGGVLIVQQIMEHFGFNELVYSEHDILDGLANDLLTNK